MYELYIQGLKVDIDQKISIQLSYAIDDVAKFSSRETSFSKTIVLPGTGRNNQIFGFIYDLASFNYEQPGAANIGAIFNVAQTSRAELRLNGLLVLRGVFRIVNIVKDKDIIEYEGALFGELSGFIAEIGNKKLEDLDFNEYNHTYTRNNIINSWDTINGSGYYYPLIDHGTYSTTELYSTRAKIDYDYRTFRPALYVKEYIDKIFSSPNSEYTYESTFLNSSFFKSLIIPNNEKVLRSLFTDLLDVSSNKINLQLTENDITLYIPFANENLKRSFTDDGDPNYTYTGSNTTLNVKYQITGLLRNRLGNILDAKIRFKKNATVVKEYLYIGTTNVNIIEDLELSISTNDTLTFEVVYDDTSSASFLQVNYLRVNSLSPILTDVLLDDDVFVKYSIPRNIMQKDFFTWILKMFNLYVTEDKDKEKHLIIEPYVDYYGTDAIDWTYKVARDKPWQIKPMGMLNGRFFEYKFKEDNDFYNEGYKKKYNQSYGDRLEDTGFQFAKDKQTLEVGFSPTPLIQYDTTEKVLPAIYKKSKGNSVDQEELMDSNIRILQAKKMTTTETWYIRNGSSYLPNFLTGGLTIYGYAGHFDDPLNPTKDINFGAASEIYFDPNTYTTNNLFNDYWSEYLAEIADKDSKILTCYVHLTPLDIAQLDFSKPILIDGILFRINKIEDYDYTNNELVKVELLKVINNG